MIKINYINIGGMNRSLLSDRVHPVLPIKKLSDKNPDEKNPYLYTSKKFDDDTKEQHIDIKI